MAYKTSYELHHHFPRLAEESGFTFNTHRPRVHIDWNKIKLIDLDSLIRERKFVLIEQHLNDILDCVLESEFDVRILDEGVMKMFRLAQLAVEYQQFCRHYLDRSVYVLREEITSLAQELDTTKKQLQNREDELRRLRRRTKHSYKTPLPYGNDNIAAMIIKTLSNKGDGIYPTTSNTDTLHHNKCNYCDKVFLNQLYLQSHITRRHAELIENPQRERQTAEQNNENAKMNAEIIELRTKLKEMEQAIIANASNQNNSVPIQVLNTPQNVVENIKESQKDMKNAEVSTNTEDYLLNKFEQWKTEEHAKYNKEINELRNQILATINSIKEKQDAPKVEPKDNKIVEQLHSTIKEQGNEILKLKLELSNLLKEKHIEEVQKNKETEAKILFWSQRAETQSKQYDALLQKLNDVAKDAKESRALAEIERDRATQLQNLLQQTIQRKTCETATTSTDDLVLRNHINNQKVSHVQTIENKKPNNNIKQMTDRNTLENLHKKAQELLNMGSITSTSSEASSTPLDDIKPVQKKNRKVEDFSTRISNSKSYIKPEPPKPIQKNNISIHLNNDPIKVSKTKVAKTKNDKNRIITKTMKETTPIKSGSPMRVVRAKLTEEVNSRLISFGVDPLKSRLPRNVFQKQKVELQQLHEIKIKKNPSYEKVRHSILAYLNSNTSISNKEVNGINEYVSPNKVSRPFKSLTSAISNVKSKALSLVKINDNNKEKRRSVNSEVTKRAMTLIRTPPSSTPESPVNIRNTDEKLTAKEKKLESQPHKIKSKQNHETRTEIESKKSNPKQSASKDLKKQVFNSDSEDSNESDHNHYNTTVMTETSKSIENLIKSPARRPASADINSSTVRKYAIENGDLFTRTQSVINLAETRAEVNNGTNKMENNNIENSSDDVESIADTPIKRTLSDETIQTVKQTKGVLKNASSMSSLNKKKVLFDMDAIQMKSVSASPSQSITEKSDGNEKYELGLVNLDGEEWDISSIENEPLKNDTKIQINTRTSPKIAELKQTIESQLARRNETPSTAIVGGVDILAGPIPRVPSIGGSNTSLGSSILDDSDGLATALAGNHKAFVKPKKVTEKDDSELDISEFSVDGIANKNESF